MINSRFLDGMTIEQAKEEVAKRLETETRGNAPVGERQVNFRLRDWGISRQRYWGCPIPVIHCPKCDVVPVPDDRPAGGAAGGRRPSTSPAIALDHHPTWKHVACPKCGGKAQRETDTMDTFVDSSWYFARFTDPWNENGADRRAESSTAWLPVDQYIGGVEHAILHLLYQPLLHPRDEGDRPHRHGRAVRRPVHAGHGGARDLSQGRTAPMSTPAEVKIEGDRRRAPRHADRRPASRSRSARSRRCRSRSATPSTPTTSSASYGADTARWFMLSDSPPERDVIWSEEGVQGAIALRAAAVAAGRRDRRDRRSRRHARPAAFSESARRSQGCPSRAGQGLGRTSTSCGSTAASRISTNSPMRWTTIAGKRQETPTPDLPGPCARPATSWSSCLRR